MSVQPFKNRRGTQIDIETETIQQFTTRIRGTLIQPHDGSYDEVRKVYNAMHDRHPALIVQAAGVADVIATVEFSQKHDLLLAVRGGGHSAAGFGTCDGGLVLDLSRMRGIRVDPQRRTVRAEGGCTWGDFDHATPCLRPCDTKWPRLNYRHCRPHAWRWDRLLEPPLRSFLR
jgi:hypothetical protein